MNKRKVGDRFCCKCEKKLEGKDFVDYRYCSTTNKHGDYGFFMVCIECEPYTKMGEYH